VSGLSVGVDVGGTFTDLAAVADDGSVLAFKVSSTPTDQSEGVEDALRRLPDGGPSVSSIVHGTTVVTNMLLERTGARVVLCATDGATDLLELRRQERAALYDLSAQHPPALVPHERVVGVSERIAPEAGHRPQLRDYWRAIAHPTMARMIWVDLALTLGPGTTAPIYIFFFHDAKKFSLTEVPTLLIFYVAAGVIGAPLWGRVAQKLGKHRTIQVACVLYAISRRQRTSG